MATAPTTDAPTRITIDDELRDRIHATGRATFVLVDSAGNWVGRLNVLRTELTAEQLEASYANPVRHTPEQVMERLRELTK